jgi:radical SAM protein with 4Fe4S-binding SPASM domain
MPLFPLTTHTRLTACRPDFSEVRQGRVLLVWGEQPFWTVVDTELATLLEALDSTTLDALFVRHPAWGAQRAAVLAALAPLRKAGVVYAGTAPVPRTQAPARIENVALNLTRRCNLRCTLCYNLPYLQADGAGELSAEECCAFLRQAKPLLGKQASLTVLGGEPLLEPEKLFAVAEQAARLGMSTLVSTNGLLVTEAIARRARELRLQVQVSLDGPTAALHERFRGKGTFARTVAGVRALVAAGAHVIVSMVCDAEHLRHLEAYYDFARSLGVAEARFIPLKRLGGAAGGAIAPAPLPELLRAAADLFTRRPELRALAGRDTFSILGATCRYSARRASCGTGLQTVLLDADGSLYPCLNTNHPAFRIANVRDAGFDFRRIWQGSSVLHTVRAQTSQLTDNPHAGCPVRFWCLGGCPGEAYAHTGNLGHRHPTCAELKRGILDMFWIMSEHPDLATTATTGC